MIPLLVAVLFLSIPAGIIAQVWIMTVSSPGFLPAVAAVVTTLMGLAFIGLAALAILTMLQDYRIRLGSTHLLLEQRFRVGLLQRYLGRELKVEREQVEGVQVHIKHGETRTLSSWCGAARRSEHRLAFSPVACFVPTWTASHTCPCGRYPQGTREGHGPGLNDLVFIERYLQTAMGLRDG